MVATDSMRENEGCEISSDDYAACDASNLDEMELPLEALIKVNALR
jgi:hypothetical protein